MLEPKNELEKRIMASEEFTRCLEYGEVRKGHPEGKVGIHIQQILAYIEEHFAEDPDYEHLRLLALLHDVGKYGGYRPHAEKSVEIARKFIQDKQFLQLIRVHDAPYWFWLKWKKKGLFDEEAFRASFLDIDWKLLVKFKYCDNCSRSQEPSHWFQEKCDELFA